MEEKKDVYVKPEFANRGLHNILEIGATLIFPFTSFFAFYLSAKAWENNILSYLLIFGSLLLGYILADFLSGMVHWAADTYGAEDTPIVGPNFIQPFRWHHIAPKAMCEHSLTGTIGNSCILGVPLQTAVILYSVYYPGTLLLSFFAWTITFMAVATVMANQFHKWAHSETRPKFAIVLQRWKLILPPDHHNTHHTKPHNTYYCVGSGWCNFFLSKINFWRTMEKIIGLFGIRPDASSHVSSDIEIVEAKS